MAEMLSDAEWFKKMLGFSRADLLRARYFREVDSQDVNPRKYHRFLRRNLEELGLKHTFTFAKFIH